MKKLIFIFVLQTFLFSSVHAHVLEDLWNKYAPGAMESQKEEIALPTPGVIYGAPPGKGESSFYWQWKYRPRTFEMHFERPEKLARSIYSLALFTRDISPDLPVEKFYKGVTGFHYSARQIADWLNNAIKNRAGLSPEENELAGELLKNGLVIIGENGFEPGSKLKHILGAAPGKKRPFAQNLRHERLHVFWDEDKGMREEAARKWKGLSKEGRDQACARLKNYNQNNEAQLLEEWAILEAESSDFSLK